MRKLLAALCLLIAAAARADAPPGFAVHALAPGIWAIEGPSEQRNATNLGNNATFGLVETREGAVLIDPGGSWKGAEALAGIVAGLTDQPVVTVIDTGGQDHRWLGNGYWKFQGAQLIASAAAVTDQKERASMQLTMLSTLIGEGLDGTEPVHADVTFDESHGFELGGRRFELANPAPAHTPGDSYVWLPQERIVFTGDIVFTGRLLGVMDFSDTKGWIDAFDAVAALAPLQVVPGHGPAVPLETARADTRDYLATLRREIGALIDDGGSITDAPRIDQSAFAYLAQFDALSGRNAQATFQQMEWE